MAMWTPRLDRPRPTVFCFTRPLIHVLITAQIMLAWLTLQFGRDIADGFLNIGPLLIWIVACGIISFIIIICCDCLPKKRGWFIGKFELLTAVSIVHCVTMVCCAGLVVALYLGALNNKMMDLLMQYSDNLQKKHLMDRIQVTFQCCGVRNITDWFFTEWRNDQIEPRRQTTLETEGWDSVPFSCCSIEAATLSPCRTKGLITFGISSLYNKPCLPTVVDAATVFLVIMVTLATHTSALAAQLAFGAVRREFSYSENNEDPEKRPLTPSVLTNKSHFETKPPRQSLKDKLWAPIFHGRSESAGGPGGFQVQRGSSGRKHSTMKGEKMSHIIMFDDVFRNESTDEFPEVPISPNKFNIPEIRSSASDPTVARLTVPPPQQHIAMAVYDSGSY